MSDRQIIEDMFKRRGIEFNAADGHPNTISVEAGYSGFYTDFTFNDLGELVSIGAYE